MHFAIIAVRIQDKKKKKTQSSHKSHNFIAPLKFTIVW